VVVGSRLLPLVLALATLAAAAVGLSGFALWLGLALVAAAAAAAFVAVSDTLEGKPALLLAVTNGVALAFVVLGSASRMNVPLGGTVPPLATYAVVAALVTYALPAVWWVLEPARATRRAPARRRLRPAEVDELLSRAA